MSPFHLAQLRHLYEQMVADGAPRLASMAKGLLGPAIADEERAQGELAYHHQVTFPPFPDPRKT